MRRDEFLEQIGCSAQSSREEIQHAYVIKRARILAIIDPTSLDSQVLKYQNTLDELDTACQEWYPEIFKSKRGDGLPIPISLRTPVWKELLRSRKFIYAIASSLILVIGLSVGFGLGMMYESKRNEKRMQDLSLRLDAANNDNEKARLKIANMESAFANRMAAFENTNASNQAPIVQLEQQTSESGSSQNGDSEFSDMGPTTIVEVTEIRQESDALIINTKLKAFTLKGTSLQASVWVYHQNGEIVQSTSERYKGSNGQLCDWKDFIPETNVHSQIISFRIPYSAFDLNRGHWNLKFFVGVQSTENPVTIYGRVSEWSAVELSL
ncbi:MAG: hypothetical protein ILNGONEN_00205 [Syntrophorhabdaceae bacterium]|nr:hypothetical protein [Syntrophorhabdaceae bacterium]